MDKYQFIEAELKKRKRQKQLRNLCTSTPLSGVEVNINGYKMLNFCSNDYLGLSKHPLLRQKAIEFIKCYGVGSTGSRLVCGSYDYFETLEKKIADLKRSEAALIFNSGFQANISILPALTDRNSLILSDKLNHNSIIQGAQLSHCKTVIFGHNDLSQLRYLLEKNQDKEYSRVLIITESVFSMDGDQVDINEMVEMAKEFQALLLVDDAHATGVLGHHGMGLTCGKSVDLTIGTFSKALGSFGSYITCSKKMRDYLINCCSGFIYTTALPPSVIGSISAALELVPTMDKERQELHHKADFLRLCLHKLGWSTKNSTTQIIPVIIGSEEKTLALSDWLKKHRILAMAIRPPTVEHGQSRIRLSLSALHTQEHIEQLINAFDKWQWR